MQFMHGTVGKEYLAMVRGSVAGERGRIDLPIGPARDSRVFVRLEAGHGKPSTTDWELLRRFEDRTLIRLVPRTGRRAKPGAPPEGQSRGTPRRPREGFAPRSPDEIRRPPAEALPIRQLRTQ